MTRRRVRVACSVLLLAVVLLATIPRGRSIMAAARAKTKAKAKAGPCAALQAKFCAPCAPMPGIYPECEDWEEECKKLMCLPLCLRLTWEVKVKAAGKNAAFNEEVASTPVQMAMQAQYLADGCVNTLGCCEDNESLNMWVEHRTFGGYFPDPVLPIKACREEDPTKRAELCTMCEGAISFELTNKKKAQCPYFPRKHAMTKAKPAGTVTAVFARSLVPAPMQFPKHEAYLQKCEDISDLAQGQFGAMMSSFKETACTCLGCCDPEPGKLNCPFPATYASPKHALDIWGETMEHPKL